MSHDAAETELFEVNWTNVSPTLKEKIFKEYIRCANLSIKSTTASGSYSANIRTLLIMLSLSFTLALQDIENKSIILTIIGFQFFKTLVSKLFEAEMRALMNNSKKDFYNLLKIKLKSRL